MDTPALPPLTHDATDEEVRQYAEMVQQRVQEQLATARQAEERYRETLRRNYAGYPVHDGARDQQPRQLQPGEFVLVRRDRSGGHFGVAARGPLVVQSQEGRRVVVRDLATGRVSEESRSNCTPLCLDVGEPEPIEAAAEG